MAGESLDALFRPASVAVVGASENPAKLGHEILKNIVDSGFHGAIYPINPKAEKILGLACFKSIEYVPDKVDLAVIVVPARAVPGVVDECGRKGVKAAVIITGGFAEAGPEGEELQNKVVEIARSHNIRILGPNCQGINVPYHPLCASWPLLTKKGRVAVISQSGTVAAAMMDWFSQEGLGVSAFVSMGNRCDIDEVDLVEYFNRDQNTSTIALYIEGLKDPPAFKKVLDNLTKPLVLLKSGRTPKGIRAAESHTRSLAGDDALYEALCKKYGLCRADTIEEFYDFAKAFAYLPRPEGNKILFVTTSGGAGILATDQAEKEGLDVAPIPPEIVESVKEVVPQHAIVSNPLDLTGDATAEMFGEVVSRTRGFYDVIGLIFGDPVERASQVVTPGGNEVVIFLGGADVERAEKAKMHERGVPVFPTPERAVKALAQLLPAHRKGKKETPPRVPQRKVDLKDTRLLSLSQALEYLKAQGLPCIHFEKAPNEGAAVHFAHIMGFPVALKVDSSKVAHKTDIGGVQLNVRSAHEVRVVFERMRKRYAEIIPDEAFPGVVVMPMAEEGIEVIMGAHRDESFGTVLLFGLGGIHVEIFQDVSTRLLPVSEDELYEMVNEIRGAIIFQGYRGRPPIDTRLIVEGLKGIAKIMETDGSIVTLDINPAILYPEEFVIVDARIIKKI
ncbi:acetate--CoA ligase family protein [Thermodesulforhabdus norvegica]|uniref:Acetyltransferase n=1 Tax=Thermodesulforhabdus norvegica TaxID=39841 RepID=A0A1I4SQD5_9BACT|nr:acetate--CoA ligase [Thermodesulforhabdus norvegica]SFM66597.1 acetyltransferase [Thermodesulforhabdus norvegica]